MESGWVYVVYNSNIQNLKAEEEGCKTYKIGITKGSVSKRFYGLGLKMPGDFICEYAYKFDNGQYGEVEKMLHNLLNQLNEGGEWFKLNANALKGVHSVCKACGGVLDTDTIQKEITEKNSIPPGYTHGQWAGMTSRQKAAAKAHATQIHNKLKKIPPPGYTHEQWKKMSPWQKAAATRKYNQQKKKR